MHLIRKRMKCLRLFSKWRNWQGFGWKTGDARSVPKENGKKRKKMGKIHLIKKGPRKENYKKKCLRLFPQRLMKELTGLWLKNSKKRGEKIVGDATSVSKENIKRSSRWKKRKKNKKKTIDPKGSNVGNNEPTKHPKDGLKEANFGTEKRICLRRDCRKHKWNRKQS